MWLTKIAVALRKPLHVRRVCTRSPNGEKKYCAGVVLVRNAGEATGATSATLSGAPSPMTAATSATSAGIPIAHVRRSLADVIRRHLAYDVPLVVFIFVCGNGVATGGLSLALPHEQGEHAHARRGDEPRRQVDDEDDRH